MAEEPTAPPPATPNGGQAPAVQITSQYIRDLSFESPNAPQTVPPGAQPRFDVTVTVGAKKQDDGDYAAEQTISVKATVDEAVLFSIELVYGGVFRLQNIPDDRIYPLLMIDCQQLLFPFARQTIATTIQGGGFPPILLQPVDFVALFRKNHPPKDAQPQAAAAPAAKTETKPN